MINFYCPNCNQKLSIDEMYMGQMGECPKCSAIIQIPQIQNYPQTNENENFLSAVSNKISDTLGVERLDGFSLKEFFSQIFRKHTWDEIEESFIVGSKQLTPNINSLNVKWPTPWIFFYTLSFVIIVHFLLLYSIEEKIISPITAILPFLLNGIIGIPFAALLFYWEMNITKNISILQILKIVWIGGWCSIIITFIMHKIGFNYENAIWAGPVEETAKLITLLFFFNNNRYPYILNGMLLGAAVGVGFAIIETGQYVVVYSEEFLEKVIVERAILSPIAHILYTGLVGGALWKLKKMRHFSFSLLFNKRFFPIYIFAIGLHMFWNSSILSKDLSDSIIKSIIILIGGYSVIFSLVQEGLKQIKTIQKL